VHGAEGARVLGPGVHLEDGVPWLDVCHLDADELGDRRRIGLARDDRAKVVDRLHGALTLHEAAAPKKTAASRVSAPYVAVK
jgi:hypothetical protein